MKAVISVILLVCLLFALPTADGQATKASNIQLEVFVNSNAWWLAVAVRNSGVDTRTVQIQQAGSSQWYTMEFVGGWGYFTYTTSRTTFNFPVSVRLTSVNNIQVTVMNAVAGPNVGLVDLGVSYSSPVVAPTTRPVSAATGAPTTKAATAAPTTNAATASPTTKTATASPATKAATASPTTKAATASPTTKAATASPTTKAATTSPTTKAATASPTTKAATAAPSGGCSSGMKVMVPLYVYPGAAWDTVIAGAKSVTTLAIINPNSGPGNGPDSAYNTYMNKMYNAGVDMVGYVYTQYGNRAISAVKADIDKYASQFPHLSGIFLDEGAATADKLAYYQELYSYIMSMPGWKYDIINPGTVPVDGYQNAATQIVTFEDLTTKFAASATPGFASCSNKDKFSVIAHTASASAMQSAVNSARSKGYYGWVYFTDGPSGCCTYNSITSYYASLAAYVAAGN